MQRLAFEETFSEGSRGLVGSTDPLVRYLTRWRMETAWRTLTKQAPDLATDPSVLILCWETAGRGQ